MVAGEVNDDLSKEEILLQQALEEYEIADTQEQEDKRKREEERALKIANPVPLPEAPQFCRTELIVLVYYTSGMSASRAKILADRLNQTAQLIIDLFEVPDDRHEEKFVVDLTGQGHVSVDGQVMTSEAELTEATSRPPAPLSPDIKRRASDLWASSDSEETSSDSDYESDSGYTSSGSDISARSMNRRASIKLSQGEIFSRTKSQKALYGKLGGKKQPKRRRSRKFSFRKKKKSRPRRHTGEWLRSRASSGVWALPDDNALIMSDLWLLTYVANPSASVALLRQGFVELVLVVYLGFRHVPPLLVDGLALHVDRKIMGKQNVAVWKPLRLILKRHREGSSSDELPTLTMLLNGTWENQTTYFLMADGFVTYLIDVWTHARFKYLLEQNDGKESGTINTVSTYGLDLEELESKFLTWLPDAPNSDKTAKGLIWFMKSVKKLLADQKMSSACNIALLVMKNGFNLLMPMATKEIFDIIGNDSADNPAGENSMLWLLSGGLVGLGVIRGFIGWGHQYLSGRIGSTVGANMRYRMFDHLQNLPKSFFLNTATGDLFAFFSADVRLVDDAISMEYFKFLDKCILIPVVLGLMAWMSWQLACIVLFITLFNLIGVRPLARKAGNSAYQRDLASASVMSIVKESVSAINVIRSFNLEDMVMGKFQDRLNQLQESSDNAYFRSAFVQEFGIMTTATSGTLSVMMVGAVLAVEGYITFGTLPAFVQVLVMVRALSRDLSQGAQRFLLASGAMFRLFTLLDEKKDAPDVEGAIELKRVTKGIEFRNVTFSYTGERDDLKDVSFEIKHGESVAIVGPSGSGKSTTLDLILRFFDVSEGQILIDGIDHRQYSRKSLLSRIGVVLQQSVLFDTSVLDNLKIGNPEATREEIEEAAEMAEIHNQVSNMPEGYDTRVGERGSRLSGGVRQRLAIARVILKNPDIYVMDEPTSALDPASEQGVNTTLQTVTQGKTAIYVTHRLNVCRDMSKIIVLEKGKIMEIGTHTELVKKLGGIYATLWMRQNGIVLSDEGDEARITASSLLAYPMFLGLNDADAELMANSFLTENIPPKAQVMKQKTPPNKLSIIVRGEVEFETVGALGIKTTTSKGKGDYFGEGMIFSGSPDGTATTKTDCTLLSLPLSSFMNVLDERPLAMQHFMSVPTFLKDKIQGEMTERKRLMRQARMDWYMEELVKEEIRAKKGGKMGDFADPGGDEILKHLGLFNEFSAPTGEERDIDMNRRFLNGVMWGKYERDGAAWQAKEDAAMDQIESDTGLEYERALGLGKKKLAPIRLPKTSMEYEQADETEKERQEKMIEKQRVSPALTWEPFKPRDLVITLMKANDLKAADSNGLSDPYCIMKLGDNERQSSMIEKTLNPVWNETFRFHHYDEFEPFKLTMMDHDRWTSDDNLGSFLIPACQLHPGHITIWLEGVETGTVDLNIDVEKFTVDEAVEGEQTNKRSSSMFARYREERKERKQKRQEEKQQQAKLQAEKEARQREEGRSSAGHTTQTDSYNYASDGDDSEDDLDEEEGQPKG